jgi:uncharacterized protein DUF1833
MRPPRLGVQYSEAIAAAMAVAPEDEIILETLEFNHPAFVDDLGHVVPVRVVNDHVDLQAYLESGGGLATFKACYFKFARPEESTDSSMPEVAIQVDNVAKILIPYLKVAVKSRVPITMIWRPYLLSDLSGPHMLPVLTLQLRNVNCDMNSVSATAGFVDLANRRFPGNEYSSKLFPGLTAR